MTVIEPRQDSLDAIVWRFLTARDPGATFGPAQGEDRPPPGRGHAPCAHGARQDDCHDDD
ncbi:hypothetical protein [Rhodobacteraceae bacterium DSL-40]|uniref:hypothetical protein n=1 Tax=Amaricoccus sp. B4 TaxID=3368557 RepID=UPI0013A6C145